MTNADRILKALRASELPLDDEELARQCGISPRQQVSQLCLRLEAQGRLARIVDPTGKVVNAIAHPASGACLCGCGLPTTRDYRPDHDARHASQVARALATSSDLTESEREDLLQRLPSEALRAKAVTIASGEVLRREAAPQHRSASVPLKDAAATVTATAAAGSSHEQRSAERIMLDLLGAHLGAALSPRRLIHASGAYVEVDGADSNLRILVECWAHQGAAKVAQKYKLVNDATKLAWIANSLDRYPERLILCVSDELAVAHLRGRSWQGAAIADLGVELEVVYLPPGVVTSIRQAQARQYR